MTTSPWRMTRPDGTCCDEASYVHESAYVDAPCELGHGTRVMHFTHIMPNAVIGSHCSIGHNVTIASGVMIGDNVRVLNNASLSSGVILEDDVYCGASTVFTPLKYVRGETGNVSTMMPTLVKRGTMIGANTTIAAGFTIGLFAFVESGSVIDGHVPDFALMYGNPVRQAGWRCECGQSLAFQNRDEIACSRCGLGYARQTESAIVQLATERPAHDSHFQSPATIRHPEGFH